MKIFSKSITGKETEILTPEHEVLVEFYKAFNTQNIKLMEQNWSVSNGIMNNPLGEILRSWENIQEVYKKIFFGKAEVYVEFYDYSIHKQGEMFFAAGRERGYILKHDKRIELDIRTSRIYAKANGRYQQLHHHGSITDVKLLEIYQALVMAQ